MQTNQLFYSSVSFQYWGTGRGSREHRSFFLSICNEFQYLAWATASGKIVCVAVLLRWQIGVPSFYQVILTVTTAAFCGTRGAGGRFCTILLTTCICLDCIKKKYTTQTLGFVVLHRCGLWVFPPPPVFIWL